MINTRCISTENKNSSLFAVNFVIFFRIEDKKEYYLKKTLCCFFVESTNNAEVRTVSAD